MIGQPWKQLGDSLGAALASPSPSTAVMKLLWQVLAAPPPTRVGDDELVRRICERLDAVDGDEDRMLGLANDLRQLLSSASSEDSVELLLEVVAERERFLGVLSKHQDGIITRTGLLSFISEQRWPEVVRHRAEQVTATHPDRLMEALSAPDVGELEALLAGDA